MGSTVQNEIWDAKPEYTSPPKISVKSSPGRDWVCGRNWGEFEIRQPYKNIDVHSETVPALEGINRAALTTPDPVTSHAGVVHGWVESGELDEAIGHAESMLDKYSMDAKNRAAIQEYVDRAVLYMERADRLWEFWADHFAPSGTPWQSHGEKGKTHYFVSVGEHPHWPLSYTAQPGCGGKVDTGNIPVKDLPYVHSRPSKGAPDTWPDFMAIRCPGERALKAHEEDAKIYIDLVVAAFENARCASEAAAAVGVFYKNRSRIAGQILKPDIPKTKYGAGVNIYAPSGETHGPGNYAPLQPDEPQPPQIRQPDPAPEDPTPGEIPEIVPKPAATKKKKGNTGILLGAAAVGVFILSRR